jgi:predicted TPR repeat methyltransferase
VSTPASLYYDKIAAVYDQATSPQGAWTPPGVVAREALKADKGGDILIIGVGTGQDIEAFKAGPQRALEGIDISEKMVQLCRAKYPRAKIHHGDFMGFEGLDKSSYEMIICSGTLEFIADLEGFLRKCAGLLSRQGSLILTYEPLIPGHSLQSSARSLTVENPQSKLYTEEFYTYRRDFQTFQTAASQAGLHIATHYDFVSYRKAEVEIVYKLVVLGHSI